MEPENDFGREEPPAQSNPESLKVETETVAVPAMKRPSTPFSLGQQVAAIALLAALAFLFGMGVGHKDEGASGTPKASDSPSPVETSSPTPIALETPVNTPSPIAVAPVPKPTPRATPKPAPPKPPPPKPKPPPPEEAPETFSLNTQPSYPTGHQGGSARETLGLMDKPTHLEINLDSDWNPVGRVQSRDYFTRSFRKTASDYELDLDVKGYSMEQTAARYRNSFDTEHRGWTPIQLAGADIAYSEGHGRSQRVQALVLRTGHYYWFSLRGNGAGLAAKFPEELQQSWDSVSVIDR